MLGKTNEKQKKAIKTILENSESLNSLVDDYLDVNKLEVNKLKIKKNEVDLKEFLEYTVKSLNHYTVDKNISLNFEIKRNQKVTLDPQRIKQVISNLVKNSVDFVPEKDGKITIRAEIGDKLETIISVEDNGIGIPKKNVKGLFKKFYTGDTSLARKHGGSGLGLAICQGIIEVHGGKIWYDEAYANGARFTFELPKIEN